MTRDDMTACIDSANKLDEVILFRSTGPWSKRWIERGYPTKNFHVKGKSSDWGPQAGFVPYLGKFSKVGADDTKADKGTAANQHGMDDGFASSAQLVLTQDEMSMQLNLACESPPRTALFKMEAVLGSRPGSDYLLSARRSGDKKTFVFRAIKRDDGRFGINVLDEAGIGGGTKWDMASRTYTPLNVMTSSEAGADNKPMTGDYDLMSVCPRWGNYGSRLVGSVSKEGLNFGGKQQPGQTFQSGANLDKVLDMSSNTGQVGQKGARGGNEHPDMGNITPRILRCINTLNSAMGAEGPFRRVHHNAESHRNSAFGALTAKEMEGGDGLPITTFQPNSLWNAPNSALLPYQSVSTLETMSEFRVYAKLLHEAGYFVPRNWTWRMSIRDR